MSTVTEIFGCNVFNDTAMREYLPKNGNPESTGTDGYGEVNFRDYM